MRTRRNSRIRLAGICRLSVALLSPFASWAGAPDDPPVSSIGLRDLHLDTTLVAGGKAKAVIVVPADGRYDKAVDRIQAAVKRATGTTLPVQCGVQDPEALLKDRNAIALGNMATNPFIEKLYCQWYCWLDLKYPGTGGYVVRSLHNPYATGHNVLLLGGSDDAGVAEAADAFCFMLKAGDPLQVGWTVKVKLGDGITAPDLVEEDGCLMPDRQGYGCREGYIRNWRSYGYIRYGWNPVSMAAGLYYMTGQKRYADYFKRMAMPDPKNLPKTIVRLGAFENPKEPLVEVADYQAHLMTLVWDLIEESPEFSDEQRLHITRELLRHQLWRSIWKVPKDQHDFVKHSTNRHLAYALLCTYTGSRYFAKYYPHPEQKWKRRVASVRKSFHETWIDSAVWPTDTIYSLPSHLQFAFDFFIMDGYEQFVASGAAQAYLDMFDMFYRGRNWVFERDDAAPILHNMATYLTKNRRYTDLMSEKQLKKTEGFNLGRSFWPPDNLPEREAAAPAAGWAAYPSAADRARTGSEGARFYAACYRGGPREDDDYILLDGYYGKARTPFHKNAILQLHMFGGKTLLSGYYNELDVLFEGECNLDVPRKAAMAKALAWDGIAYVRTEITNMTQSCWEREILYAKELGCVVVDRLTPQQTGRFSVQCTWQFEPARLEHDEESRAVTTSKGAALHWTHDLDVHLRRHTLVQEAILTLQSGKTERLVNFVTMKPDGPDGTVRFVRAGEGLFVVQRGGRRGLIVAGNQDHEAIRFRGGLAYLTPEGITAVDAEELNVEGRPVLTTGAPVSFRWDLAKNTVAAGDERDNASLNGRLVGSLALQAGGSQVEGERLPAEASAQAGPREPRVSGDLRDWRERIEPLLAQAGKPGGASTAARNPEPGRVAANWLPRWTLPLGRRVRLMESAADGRIWVACEEQAQNTEKDKAETGRLYGVATTGKPDVEIACESEILSLWPANTPRQARHFAVVLGLRDDRVRAYDGQGRQVWQFKALPDPSYKLGDKWKSPYFSDPEKCHGVYCMLAGDFWNTGREELVIGRAVTLEFHELDGKLVRRMPEGWSTNTRLAAWIRRGNGKPDPVLLAATSHGGIPSVSAIGPPSNERGKLGYRRGYGPDARVPGASGMYAWSRNGVRDLKVADLDGDGVDDLVAAWSGHWNEIKVFDGAAGKEDPTWMKYFGPDFVDWIYDGYMRNAFVAAVEVADMNGDGKRQVLVGLKSGWLHAYDHTGRTLWRRHFPDTGVRGLAAVPGGVAVGLRDGRLLLLNARGQTVRTADLGASVEALALVNGNGLVGGTRDGTLAAFATGGAR
ncbi:MAG: hypothetical protein JXR37_10150 [Kiritimatiellae bacterium]|nr:hypothetical protein [Kiritimatiellia bacterium]